MKVIQDEDLQVFTDATPLFFRRQRHLAQLPAENYTIQRHGLAMVPCSHAYRLASRIEMVSLEQA